jgi:hypothetical protein
MRSGKISIALLVFFLFAVSMLMYAPVIHLFPSFIHAWTQSDRYAIALRFLDNGFDLFHPATFNYQTVEGITRIDFPINEYIVALLMKISGSTSPAIFRTYTLCISIAGLVYLYLLSGKITGSVIKSWLTVLFVFFSPVYFYYQAGFIPSIPAISSLFAAYYYFFSYRDSGSRKQLLKAVLFFLLAALVRFPFVIFLFAAFLQQLFGMIIQKKLLRKEVLYFLFAFAVFGGYYLYNVHLGRLYGNMFLDTVMPARNASEFREILSEIYHHWGTHYFSAAHYLLAVPLLAVLSYMLIRRRSFFEEQKGYVLQLLIAGAGTFIYFLLMLRQFYAHDYYFLDSLFVPCIMAFMISLTALPAKTTIWKWIWPGLLAAYAVTAFVLCSRVQEERYTTGPWDRTEITRKNFTGTAEFLDTKGFSKNAKILVIDAYTTNAPLILMNRKGYTVMGTTERNIALTMAWAKWDYVAIQDAYLVSDVIHSYPLITTLLERVAGNGKVSFYKRNSGFHSKTLKQFLGIGPGNTFKYDNTGSGELKLEPVTEYGYTTTVTPGDLKEKENLKALVSLDMLGKADLHGIRLVASFGEYYQEFFLQDYFKNSGRWQHAEFQFALPENPRQDAELKIYLWNPEKNELSYKNWEVIVYK